MFSPQITNQNKLKVFTNFLQLGLVVLVLTLAAVSCSDNPVGPNVQGDPGSNQNQNSNQEPLTVSISSDPESGTPGVVAKFTSVITGGTAPYTYNWLFADGGTSSVKDPTHTFDAEGIFIVSLIVTDAMNQKDTAYTSVFVSHLNDLTCSVTANKTSGRAPLTVSFTGTASNGRAPYTYKWEFGDGNTSTDQNPSHTYQNPGTYTAKLTVTDAYTITAQKTITINALSAPAGPVLSGPGTVTTDFLLSWTFTWPTLAATGEVVAVEESTTSPSTGFTQITTVSRTQPSKIVITNRAPGTYYYRVRAYINQGANRGWTEYSNVVRVVVQAPVSKTRFVNNTSYIIISLKVDGTEYFTNSSMGLMPGQWLEINLSPGSHSYFAANGFWDGSSRFTMYNWNGSVFQNSGNVEMVNFNDPTINQLLTQFKSTGLWVGDFWENLVPHKAAFRFNSNGTFKFYVDGTERATGNYRLVRRDPSSFSVVFTVGDYEATLYETQGRFVMRNGPPDWPLIEYLYSGQ